MAVYVTPLRAGKTEFAGSTLMVSGKISGSSKLGNHRLK